LRRQLHVRGDRPLDHPVEEEEAEEAEEAEAPQEAGAEAAQQPPPPGRRSEVLAWRDRGQNKQLRLEARS